MADNGRDLKIQLSADGGTTYTTIASVRSKGFAGAAEAVDVTTDDANGWRTLLANPATRSVDLSVSGVTEDNDLKAAFFAGSYALQDAQLLYANGDKVTGSFFLSSLSDNGEHTGSVTFEASLQSSGPVTFTAA